MPKTGHWFGFRPPWGVGYRRVIEEPGPWCCGVETKRASGKGTEVRLKNGTVPVALGSVFSLPESSFDCTTIKRRSMGARLNLEELLLDFFGTRPLDNPRGFCFREECVSYTLPQHGKPEG
jgi:hypothetical protein